MEKVRSLVVISLLSFLLGAVAASGKKDAGESRYKPLFDYISGSPGNRVCLRLPGGSCSVKALLYCHQNMTEEVLFRSPLFTGRMDSLG
ncbi:MAG: hypothetical protein K2H49_07910, partial [Muribaculaceae bacterium]|nr:hypothetical protein [Muribaculaceae bacterium]